MFNFLQHPLSSYSTNVENISKRKTRKILLNTREKNLIIREKGKKNHEKQLRQRSNNRGNFRH